jgi:hypothetical protein
MADQSSPSGTNKAAPAGTPKPYAPLPPGQQVPSMPALWRHAMKNYGRYQVLPQRPWRYVGYSGGEPCFQQRYALLLACLGRLAGLEAPTPEP